LVPGDKLFEILDVLREVDLGGDDRIQPPSDEVPNTCRLKISL
jgi:hypothetical protein